MPGGSPCCCAAARWTSSCTVNGQCAAGHSCHNGLCVAGSGVPCTDSSECRSGFCVDKVCCEGACAGTCEACDLQGAIGSCAPVPTGSDPRNDCAAEPVSTCGLDGECDGNGACRKYAYKTVCNPGQCVKSYEHFKLDQVKGCDNNGNCKLSLPDKDCPGNFACDTATDQCYTACTSDSQCNDYWACDVQTQTCYTTCTQNSHCKDDGGCFNGVCND